jgi:ribulose-5-phosphate 4-epimerase/fuculose-1-phosphate aldolase
MTFTHISARVPGPEHHFLINPYGTMFEEITASSFVKVDLEGRKLLAGSAEINPAGFVIHSAVHAARDDANCALHVHSVNGVAVSAQDEGLLPLSQHSIFVLASLGYHDYEGVALDDDEKPRLVRDLGANRFLMLRNHGLLTVGRSVAEAFVAMYFFEAACMMQVRAQAGGGKLRLIGSKVLDGAEGMWDVVTKGAGGGLAWPALRRKLDRIDPSYRN